jgi:predicted metalloprotease with PDZ domain
MIDTIAIQRTVRTAVRITLGVALTLAGTASVPRADEPIVITTDPSVRVLVGEDGESAYLGVRLEEETEHSEGGARVTRVVDESPAADAGLREGDIIVGFDGETIRGPVGLTKQIHAKKPGDTVSVTVIRDGREMPLEVELGNRAAGRWAWTMPEISVPEIDPQQWEELGEHLGSLGQGFTQSFDCEDDDCVFVAPGAPGLFCDGDDCSSFSLSWGGRPKLGVQLVETTAELRTHLGGEEDAGVLVSKVLEGTPAEQAGIEVGDLIVAVDGERVKSTTGLRRALADKTGETFDVEVMRDGQSRRLEVTIPEPDNDVPTGPRALFVPRAPAAVVPVQAVPLPVAPRIVVPVAPVPPAAPAPPAPAAPRRLPSERSV